MLAHVDAGGSLADWPGELPAGLEPLTTKPLLAVENGPGGIDLKLEAELAELGEDAAEFREGRVGARGGRAPAERRARTDQLLHRGRQGDARVDAAARRNALEAAETIHSDIARGFIRARSSAGTTSSRAGSHAEAARGGLQRLEGKTYVVQDGDVLNVRFNV